MKKSFFWLLLLILLNNPVFPGAMSAGEHFRVTKVYDGDTILLGDGRKVRYLGMNAPEYQEPFYLKAKRFNESLVLEKEIRLEFDQEKVDSYDRMLAYVYVGNQMVNVRLVEEGLAHAFFIGPNRKHNGLLLKAQAAAKEKKAGIWSGRGRPRDLKITSVHIGDPDHPPYVRIANLSNGPMRLAGYLLSNESGKRYLFPDITITPGYTVIVDSTEGTDGVDHRGQLVVHWPMQGSVWDPKEDTAFLTNPSGEMVDSFHYKGKRIRTTPSYPSRKAP